MTGWQHRWQSTAGADQLILLSRMSTGSIPPIPAQDPSARCRFDVIEEITPEIEAMAGDAGSGLKQGRHDHQADGGEDRDGGQVCDMAITEGSRHCIR